MLDADEVQDLYDGLAGSYDLATSLYDLVGAQRLRARAVDLLDLAPGDTVVDLGCGTGVNLPLLVRAVGDQGRAIGVDLSAGMLRTWHCGFERLVWFPECPFCGGNHHPGPRTV